MQGWIFTLAITVVSRSLILRDRLLGRLRPRPETARSRVVVTTHVIPSGANLLDARFFAPVEGPVHAGLLICHGIGETVAHWDAAQRLLAENGVASLVFNYSGYGKSTGWISPQQCEADAVVAFSRLGELVTTAPLSLLGYSLGSAVAAAVAPLVRPKRLILCAAFTSLREAARSVGVPWLLARLLPAIWMSVDALKTCAIPVVILHGENDELFSPEMARRLGASCGSVCEVIVVPETSHNGPIYRPALDYWSLVISRL
jgi:pimeloyl-ACP methyl ester carboxylesterase